MKETELVRKFEEIDKTTSKKYRIKIHDGQPDNRSSNISKSLIFILRQQNQKWH